MKYAVWVCGAAGHLGDRIDNIRMSEYVDPPLTTIHVPRDVVGQVVFESLLQGSERNTRTGRELAIEPGFLVREWTAPAPLSDRRR